MRVEPLSSRARERIVLIIGAIAAAICLCNPPWYADIGGRHVHAGHHGMNLHVVWPHERLDRDFDAEIDLPLLAIELATIAFVTLCLARAVR